MDEALVGINLNSAVFVRGSYEQKGDIVKVVLVAVEGMMGEAFGQAEVEYDFKKKVEKALVAVLDIKADFLPPVQQQGLSEVFRSVLADSGAFKMASSSDVARMDADAIQKTSGCTRDECATIIGEQLGVDRTISTSILKFSEQKYILSSKILNIEDGSIVASKTVTHNGPASELQGAIVKLAEALTGGRKQAQVIALDTGPGWGLHLSATGLTVVGYVQAQAAATSFKNLESKNKALIAAYEASTNVSERTALNAEYTANQDKMKQEKTKVTQFNALSGIGLLWETWLVYSSWSAPGSTPLEASRLRFYSQGERLGFQYSRGF